MIENSVVLEAIRSVVGDKSLKPECVVCKAQTILSLQMDIKSDLAGSMQLPLEEPIAKPISNKNDSIKSKSTVGTKDIRKTEEVHPLAAELVEYIESHDMNLSTVGREIGVDAVYLRDMVKGYKKITKPALLKISTWLKSHKNGSAKVIPKENPPSECVTEEGDPGKSDLLEKLIAYRRRTQTPMHEIAKECGFRDIGLLLTILEGGKPTGNINYDKIEQFLRKVGDI